METRVLLIDAFNLIRRIFEARPDGGENIDQVIQSSVKSVARALKQHPASHACIVFDSHDTTWRHLLYPAYKQGRKPTPRLLLDNLQNFQTAFQMLGVESLTIETYEADDVIATFAVGLADRGAEVIILSTDKGFLQLLSDRTRVFNHFEECELDRDVVARKYEVEVEQLTAYWALAGDQSNNIKGVPKVGKKTAVSLIRQYGSLEDILADDHANASALRVQEYGDLAQQCKHLVTLKTDIQLGINLKSFRLPAWP